MRMIATKSMTYATRRLRAGEAFDAKRRTDAVILEAIKKARPVEDLPAKDDAGDDLAALRALYQEKLGKRPFNGWDAATLRAKIAAA